MRCSFIYLFTNVHLFLPRLQAEGNQEMFTMIRSMQKMISKLPRLRTKADLRRLMTSAKLPAHIEPLSGGRNARPPQKRGYVSAGSSSLLSVLSTLPHMYFKRSLYLFILMPRPPILIYVNLHQCVFGVHLHTIGVFFSFSWKLPGRIIDQL